MYPDKNPFHHNHDFIGPGICHACNYEEEEKRKQNALLSKNTKQYNTNPIGKKYTSYYFEDCNGQSSDFDDEYFDEEEYESEYNPSTVTIPKDHEIYQHKFKTPSEVLINRLDIEEKNLINRLNEIKKERKDNDIQRKIEILNKVKQQNSYICIDGQHYASILYAGKTSRGFGVKYKLYNKTYFNWTAVESIQI